MSVPPPIASVALLWLLACVGEKGGSTPADDSTSPIDSDSAPEAADSADTGDTDDTGGAADTADTADTGPPTDSTSPTDTDTAEEPEPPTDEDGDGYLSDVDCDDDDTAVYPGAEEICNDGAINGCGEASDLDCTLAAERTLADANLILTGELRASDSAGASVSGAGDFDGDGHPDLAIGAYDNNAGGSRRGASFVVLGATMADWSGTVSLDEADLELMGEEDQDESGSTLLGPGDVDGDGYDDLYVGAWNSDQYASDAGVAYWVAGPDVSDGERSLSDADLELYQADSSLYVGSEMAAAGDVDADGQADLILGMIYGGQELGWAYPPGSATLLLGVSAAGTTSDLDLSRADLVLQGVTENEHAGACVAGDGDVDGDGLSDLLIGAYNAWGTVENSGTAYLVLGASAYDWLGTVTLSDADLAIEGSETAQYVGAGVALPGDVDGDGLDDLLIGARFDNTGARYAGSVSLMLSATLGSARGAISVETADVELTGPYEEAQLGTVIAGAGDVDADGLADVLIGKPGYLVGGLEVGAVWMFTGASLAGSAGSLEVTGADTAVYGTAEWDALGVSVDAAGDVDGDGLDDMLIGASGAEFSSSRRGAALLVAGGGY